VAKKKRLRNTDLMWQLTSFYYTEQLRKYSVHTHSAGHHFLQHPYLSKASFPQNSILPKCVFCDGLSGNETTKSDIKSAQTGAWHFNIQIH